MGLFDLLLSWISDYKSFDFSSVVSRLAAFGGSGGAEGFVRISVLSDDVRLYELGSLAVVKMQL